MEFRDQMRPDTRPGPGRGLRRIVADKLFGEVITEAATKLAEAQGQGVIDPDDFLYSSIGTTRRDIPAFTHDRAIEVCFELYQRNPLAHRITELNRDFIVGDGIRYSARNPDVEEAVADCWDDPVNNLDQRLDDYALEIGLWGELAPEALTGETSGAVQLGYIDPANIKAIVPWDQNPVIADQLKVRRKGQAVQGKALDIVRRRDGQYLEGDTFYFRVNGLTNSSRGWPDLLHLADWLDIYDQMLWEMLERARLMHAFVWDVMLAGADKAQITEWLRQHPNAPRSGTMRVHNDQEQWNAVSPTLNADDIEKNADTILSHIATGAGFPKTWLGKSDNVNRAVSQTMDVPHLRRLSQRQRTFLQVPRTILEYQLDQYEKSQGLSVDAEGLIPAYDDQGNEAKGLDGKPVLMRPIDLVELHAPEIGQRDLPSIGDLLQKVSGALAVAEMQGWFGPSTSRQTIAQILALLGVDYDPTDQPEDETATSSPEIPTQVQEAVAMAIEVHSNGHREEAEAVRQAEREERLLEHSTALAAAMRTEPVTVVNEAPRAPDMNIPVSLTVPEPKPMKRTVLRDELGRFAGVETTTEPGKTTVSRVDRDDDGHIIGTHDEPEVTEGGESDSE